jgi:hypothetical protein
MSFAIRELPKARLDKRNIFAWLDKRSPSGALAWLDAYDSLLERLQQDAAACGSAPESHDCDFDVRQALFKTRRGRVYRVLFFLEGQEVFILRLRGPGQAPITPEEMK